MKLTKTTPLLITSLLMMFLISGCAPEVGSKAWCENLDKKSKSEWTANETTNYVKNCLFE